MEFNSKIFALLLFVFSFLIFSPRLLGVTGFPLWANSAIIGPNKSKFLSVTVDLDGNVYGAGYMDGTETYDFGNGVTVVGSFSADNLVIVKYNSNGEAQWARSVSGQDASVFYSVDVDSDGNVYAAGVMLGTDIYDFGNGIAAAGTHLSHNFMLVKYDSSGNVIWARTAIAGSGQMNFRVLNVDSRDNTLYVGGYVERTGTFDLGNGVTVAGPYFNGINAIPAKYDSNGNAQWAISSMAGANQSSF